MAGESIAALLASLTATSGESAESIYAKWSGLTVNDGHTQLFELVRRKLTANAKAGQIRESLTGTLRAGGAVGETVEECLLKSGLTGWS